MAQNQIEQEAHEAVKSFIMGLPKSKRIDEQLEKSYSQEKEIVKILILGGFEHKNNLHRLHSIHFSILALFCCTGNDHSGKSTVFHQFQTIFTPWLRTDTDRTEYRAPIREFCQQSLQSILSIDELQPHIPSDLQVDPMWLFFSLYFLLLLLLLL
jgi:excinuclease UvrABC ATPase subunit